MYSLYAIIICIIIHIEYSSGEPSDAFERVTSEEVAAYKEYLGFKMQTYERNTVPEAGFYKVCFFSSDNEQPIDQLSLRRHQWNCCKRWKYVEQDTEFVSAAYDHRHANACIIGEVGEKGQKIRSERLLHRPDAPWYTKNVLILSIILVIIIGICLYLCVIVFGQNFAKQKDTIIEEKDNDRRPNTV